MEASLSEVVALGEFSSWAKQLLNQWQTEDLIRLSFEASVPRFCSTHFSGEVSVALLENNSAAKLAIGQIRSSGKNVLILWLGQHFSREDLEFALEQRVYATLENPVSFDKRTERIFTKCAALSNQANQKKQLLRNLKILLVPTESEGQNSEFINELKTGLIKLERSDRGNELFATEFASDNEEGSSVPLAQSISLGDTLLTITDFERTGTLWIKGKNPGEEGKIDFIQGKISFAEAGAVQQLKAIYRMFLWDTPRFLFNRKKVEVGEAHDLIPTEISLIVQEGELHAKRFELIKKEAPPSHLKLALEAESINPSTHLSPTNFQTLIKVVEYSHVTDVLDYSPSWDIDLYEGLIQLRKMGHIKVVAPTPSAA